MKKLFESNRQLKDLYSSITERLAKINRVSSQKNGTKYSPTLSSHDEEGKKAKAARIIQRRWRNHKVREAIIDNSYFSYLSLIEPDDEQRLLSAIMFGRHEAELRAASPDKSDNPFADFLAAYHRCDAQFSGLTYKYLYKSFDISEQDLKQNYYIPISKLKTISLEEIITLPNEIKTITKEDQSIALIAIPKDYHNIDEIRKTLRSSGVVATPWEIAENVKEVDFDYSKSLRDIKEISLDPNLPNSREKLLESEIWLKLGMVASNSQYPTKKLASCLRRLLINLPELTPKAMQRIALMLDLANTFYGSNYSRYAFFVYAIVHEISLGLSQKKEKDYLDRSFTDFLQETKTLFCRSFNLADENLVNSRFIASPALSGMNAFEIAKKIANKMEVKSGEKPHINLVKPCVYYEFDYKKDHINSDNPDIFVLSTGPIFTSYGIAPGVDINRFIKRNIIDKKVEKPITIIIDTTTTLYKNLELSEEAKKLISDGKLSILIAESQQKFGLLHTDQAQHGRLFGFCAKQSFSEEFINEMQEKARLDFNEHTDMRIGAFISNHCGSILEDIKQQHFTNGAILRNILTQTQLAAHEIIGYEDMQTNLNELYFVNSPNLELKMAIDGIVETRDSFGHYNTTTTRVANQIRLVANATDDIDCLIEAAQIYLAQYYQPEQLLGMLLENARKVKSLSLEEQIMSLAMINNGLLLQKTNPQLLKKNFLLSYAISDVLDHCSSLSSRASFVAAQSYLTKLKKQHGVHFLDTMKYLYQNKITVNSYIISHLKANPYLCEAIPLLEKPINLQDITNLIRYPQKLTAFLATEKPGIEVPVNEEFFNACDILSEKNIPIDPFIFSHLNANARLTKAISLLKGIDFDKNLVLSLIDQPRKLISLINYHDKHPDKLASCQSCIETLKQKGIKINLEILHGLLMNPNTQTVLPKLLKNDLITMHNIEVLIKPEATAFMMEQQTVTNDQVSIMVVLDNLYESYHVFYPLLKDENMCKILLHIIKANTDVLTNLKSSPEKYALAKEQAATYLIHCFDAVKKFANTAHSNQDQIELKTVLVQAKNTYCQKVLDKHTNPLSEGVDLIFKIALGAVMDLLVISQPFLGDVYKAGIKQLNKMAFFTSTHSRQQLSEAHDSLDKLIDSQNEKSGIAKN